jgi:metal transporter CNNM
MRANLRLGPANRATNPLNNSRGTLFKIKQGLEAGRGQPARPASHLGLLNRHYGTSIGENTPLLIPRFDELEDHRREEASKTNGNGAGGKNK